MKKLAIFPKTFLVLFFSLVVSVSSAHALSSPTGFQGSASGNTVTLKWNPVSGATGYILHQQNAGSLDLGNITSRTFTNVKKPRHYVSLSAYNASGESAKSNVLVIDLFPSSPLQPTGSLNLPTGFQGSASGNTVTLRWNPVSGATGYILYQQNAGALDLGNITSRTFTNVKKPSHYLALSSYNASGESTKSNVLVINLSPVSTLSVTFEERIANYKAWYGKSDEWANWMRANKARYQAAFDASSSKPDTINVSFRYKTTKPINSPWTDEAKHMNAFATMAEAAFPGYNFNFMFGGNTNTSYANVISGIPLNTSYSFGKDVYLYYEGIFNHEFAHTMKLQHHYDGNNYQENLYMPPGDTTCILARDSYMFCSGCRTALGIPLDISNANEIKDAMSALYSGD